VRRSVDFNENAFVSESLANLVNRATGSDSGSQPQPFDTNVGNNFTQPSCQTFFNDFLSNQQFQSCIPFSLLLRTSQAFFQASKSATRVTSVQEATCAVDFNNCSILMNNLGNSIQSEANCAADYQLQNPLVLQAYEGFLAYQPLYQAGCLRDASDGSYCK